MRDQDSPADSRKCSTSEGLNHWSFANWIAGIRNRLSGTQSLSCPHIRTDDDPGKRSKSIPSETTELMKIKCPDCGSDKVYRSRSGNASLSSLQRVFVVSVRCHRCKRLFDRSIALGGSLIADRPRHRVRKRGGRMTPHETTHSLETRKAA